MTVVSSPLCLSLLLPEVLPVTGEDGCVAGFTEKVSAGVVDTPVLDRWDLGMLRSTKDENLTPS